MQQEIELRSGQLCPGLESYDILQGTVEVWDKFVPVQYQSCCLQLCLVS